MKRLKFIKQLLNRSIQRPKVLHYKKFSDETEYMPLAS